MVVLRDGMCPGLSEELVEAFRAADITTGRWVLIHLFTLVNLAS